MNISIFKSINIKNFEAFCYELFSEEKIIDAYYDNYLTKINSLSIKENKVDNTEENIGEIVSIDYKSKYKNEFTDVIKKSWSNISKFIVNYNQEYVEIEDLNNKYSSECQYVMISMADEIFLKKNNIVSDYWKDNLLEYYFYGSRSSGTIVFDKIEKLILDGDRHQTDIAYIYLTILGLGFKGKYCISKSDEKIKIYKKELYSIIIKYEENGEQNNDKIFSNSLSIPKSVNEVFLPDIKRWYLYIFSSILVYIIISSCMWYIMTMNLSDKIGKYNILIHEMGK